MNILLEFTTLNYRIWHAQAKRLKKIYPEARFAGLVGVAAGGEFVFDFLRNQKDIHYEFLEPHSEIFKNAFNGEIDWEAIKQFEENLPGKSIWRIVAADKFWGSHYVHGAVVIKTFITENNSRENVLKVLSGCIKSYKKIFDDFKVDVFLPAICMGSVAVHILEQLCRQRNVPYLIPSYVRIDKLFAFSTDVLLRFPHIDETYRQLMDGRLQLDLTRAEKLYEKIMGELEDSQNFDRKLPGIKVVKLTTLSSKFKILFLMGKSVLGRIKSWIERRKFNQSDDMRRQPYKLSILLNNIMWSLRFYWQKFSMLAPDFGAILPPGQKYIYYPLHTSPEYSTNVQGTMWMNQLYNIELLSKSIPADWVVYIKEHPATLPARVRPPNFFKEILKYPNVRMAPLDLDTHKIICNAQMLAVVTGTSGWEAVQRGIPVLTFTVNFFDVLGLSLMCNNIEHLSKDIADELKRFKTIPPQERKKRLVCYFAAILEHSFEITYPDQFYYEEGVLEHFEERCEVIGAETADALSKHLEFLQGKKEFALR